MDEFIGINEIARIKGLKSTRSIRLAINQGKYIARQNITALQTSKQIFA